MAKVILHIGMHKTGTTAVQKTFFDNRQALLKKGFAYPDIRPAQGHHALVTKWLHKMHETYHPKEGADALWSSLVEKYADTDKTLFLSSEEFSRGRPSARVNFSELREMLAPFEEVRAICTLRHQVPFLQSIYSEVSKKRVPQPWKFYLAQALKSKYAAGLFLDYNDLNDHLREGFSTEEICYLDYQSCVTSDTSLQMYLLNLAGIDIDQKQIRFQDGGRSNVSLSPLSVWAAMQVSAPEQAPSDLIYLSHSLLEQHLNKRPTTFFSRSEERRTLAYFNESNQRFESEVQKTDPNFRLTPHQFPKDIVYREDIRTRFWLDLAREIYAS